MHTFSTDKQSARYRTYSDCFTTLCSLNKKKGNFAKQYLLLLPRQSGRRVCFCDYWLLHTTFVLLTMSRSALRHRHFTIPCARAAHISVTRQKDKWHLTSCPSTWTALFNVSRPTTNYGQGGVFGHLNMKHNLLEFVVYGNPIKRSTFV